MVSTDEVRRMVEGGMSVAAIAEELDVSSARISQLVHALGLGDSVKRKSSLSRLTPEDIADAIAMYQDGQPVAAIIMKHKLNYNSFYKLLGDQGIEMRDRGPEGKDLRKDRLDLAVSLYERGISLYSIEVETGIRQPEVHRELHKRGIQLRRTSRALAALGKLGMGMTEDDIDLDNLSDRERELLKPEDDNA